MAAVEWLLAPSPMFLQVLISGKLGGIGERPGELPRGAG